ncbi:SMI1/KNR4 family protein [Actinacidiphila rubida]|uniref:Knr4/Smi1-like domain-containing protein n=1 Tax=Actinacidiphila rubida TaxID=310780 RepID=A0A1H8TCT2_9ACTN|nr:SMI1/KNR4 family protein [Actinacidiphila rubida]SEO88727.1 hypothetical protein SAMN05216267_105125 [Actinacidiphila rubida]
MAAALRGGLTSTVVHVNDLEACFGQPRGYSTVDAWEELEAAVGPLPSDYKEFVAAYGPGVVGGFLHVLHPASAGHGMFEIMERMAPLYQELVPGPIPHPVFPSEPGMVQWAITVEGDACFLVPRPGGGWRIGVWFRQWAQWEEYEDSVPDWLLRQAGGTLVIDGLPLHVRGGFVPVD